jgi:hypothetical protein
MKPIDHAAVVGTVTAPAWAIALSQINTVLTFVSLVLGIAFLLWRWWRTAGDSRIGE